MRGRHVCVCGGPAERSIPRGIDGLFVEGGSEEYEMVCGECYRRIWRLGRRFRPSFWGYVLVTVVYDPGSRIFTIWAFNSTGIRHISGRI